MEITGSEPFVVNKGKTTSQYLSVKDEVSDYECSFVAPVGIYNKIHKKGVLNILVY